METSVQGTMTATACAAPTGAGASSTVVASAWIYSSQVVPATKTRIVETATNAFAIPALTTMGWWSNTDRADVTANAIKAGAMESTKYTKACFAQANA